MATRYEEFLNKKSQLGSMDGFEPVWVPDFLFDFQKSLVEWSIKKGRAAIFADCGLGKGQPLDAPVLTPNGWVAIGSLNPGDQAIASDGKPYEVVGVYPKCEQNTYRVHYSDNVSIVVDLDHLHIVRTNNDRQRSRPWRVMSTSDLLVSPLRYGQSGKSRNYDIPVVEDIEFAWSDLPIDPYILGAFLGDGHLKGNLFLSSADSEVVDAVRARLPVGVALEYKSQYDWKIKTGLTGSRRHPFRQSFVDLGLWGLLSADKFIPDAYWFASAESRLAMLRGLMDTDGYIQECGTSQFYSVSSNLADGVVHLVRSLGGIPTRSIKQTSCNGITGQPCHIVTFSLATHNPFLLPRKAERWNDSPRDNGRWIDRIEFEKRQRTVCISVDSPDSSYVTENFVVTHNTPIQLVWAQNVVEKTNKPVLIVTPLAVSRQTIEEGAKFGIDCQQSRDGKFSSDKRIIVTNYERLPYFDQSKFSGMVCDESSAIKNFKGKRKAIVTEFMRLLPYRLLCTATASPNDYQEMGTSSEALGYLGYTDMITKFFKQDDKKDHHAWGRMKYRFRGHAEKPFWRWVCSWARAIRRPSDLGFSDEKFVLPALTEKETILENTQPRSGQLFTTPARDLKEQREDRRKTLDARCEIVARSVPTDRPAVIWCHLNDEADMLERIIPDARQVKGAMSDEAKEERLLAFSKGELRVLVTKPKIGCWGLNWQHCSDVFMFPSHSFEQYYQAVRRCWRFGQTREVTVNTIVTEGEVNVLKNLKRKSNQSDKMFSELVIGMSNELRIDNVNKFTSEVETPGWI